MKLIIATIIAVFASLLSVSSATAQKIGGRVEIPFSFTAGNTQLPPGVYFLKTDGNHASISTKGVSWASYINPNLPLHYGAMEKVEMVFSIYGDQHFLRKIQCGPGDVMYELPISKAERGAQQTKPTYLGN